MTEPVILVVDDEPAVGRVLVALLGQAGMAADHVLSGELALAALERRPYQVVVTDIRMPGMDGMAVLRTVTTQWPEIPVIVLTAHGTVASAVDAMKAGAADYLLKPFDRDEVVFAVRKALTRADHDDREAVHGLQSPEGFGGSSRAMSECLDLVRRASQGTATVLLRGETGVGKDVAARAIHEQSARSAGPFVKVHCAAFPDTLLESELFGYEKGAFTGAAARKLGRVDLAQGGTLFLDEIGEVKPATQVKLLQLLQDRSFERLGGTETLKADVRFVAATHRDLESMVSAGEFREDLFYRLCVLPIWVPPLRDRPEDVEMLAHRFVKTAASEQGRGARSLSAGAIALLRTQRWPGNVRQLQNFIERLVILGDRPVIEDEDVRRELGRQPIPAPVVNPAASQAGGAASFAEPSERHSHAGGPARDRPSYPGVAGERPSSPGASREEAATLADRRRSVERQAILDALQQSGDNRTVAARILGLSRRTFYNKLRDLGIS
ncbi:MAG: sigma-54-dependent Fis family transcriptional regulator [Deltaproteobacteria bacterium]|nr:sigma-54-dependent Fis family transcriptional regulator [Deltaproteobacteria bacterium]